MRWSASYALPHALVLVGKKTPSVQQKSLIINGKNAGKLIASFGVLEMNHGETPSPLKPRIFCLRRPRLSRKSSNAVSSEKWSLERTNMAQPWEIG